MNLNEGTGRLKAIAYLSALASVISPPLPAHAINSWSAGATAGWVGTPIDSTELNQRLADQGLSGSSHPTDTHRLGGRLNLSWHWHENWSLEAGYAWLGDVNSDVRNTGPLTADDIESIRIGSGSGPELAINGTYPIAKDWSIYGRLGVWHWQSEYEMNSNKVDLSGNDLVLGTGVQLRLSDHWSSTLGWDGYQVDEDMNHMFGLGLQFRFGGSESTGKTPKPVVESVVSRAPLESVTDESDAEVASQSVAEAAPTAETEPKASIDLNSLPATAAAESEPEPMPVYEEQLTSLNLQLKFDIGQSVLRIEKNQLKPIADWLIDNPAQQLLIQGHTDNTGPDSLNEQLSLRRADVVAKTTLELGVNTQQLITKGLSYRQPIASNATAEGRQSNRRVEITLLD